MLSIGDVILLENGLDKEMEIDVVQDIFSGFAMENRA